MFVVIFLIDLCVVLRALIFCLCVNCIYPFCAVFVTVASSIPRIFGSYCALILTSVVSLSLVRVWVDRRRVPLRRCTEFISIFYSIFSLLTSTDCVVPDITGFVRSLSFIRSHLCCGEDLWGRAILSRVLRSVVRSIILIVLVRDLATTHPT